MPSALLRAVAVTRYSRLPSSFVGASARRYGKGSEPTGSAGTSCCTATREGVVADALSKLCTRRSSAAVRDATPGSAHT